MALQLARALLLCAPFVFGAQARTADAWAIGSQLDNDGCHELITAEALRAVRATLDTAPALTPTRDEAAMIADVLFTPPDDLVKDLAGMTLLLGVRDNDLKGIDPLSSLELIQVHGDPDTQHEHCIRASTDDDIAGNEAALATCRAYIVQLATEALGGLDASGIVDPTIRAPFTLHVGIRGEIEPSLPLFYLRISAAMHALQDGFPHTYRTGDGMKVTVVLNSIDPVNGPYDEPRDGPPHRAELDRCWESDPILARNYELSIQASTELLYAALDPTLGRDAKIALFDSIAAKYHSFDGACTFDNNWCDSPEAEVTNSITGCDSSGPGGLGLALAVLVVVFGVRRRRAFASASVLIVFALATPARADDPPPTAAEDQPGVPIPAADPDPHDGTEPGRDAKTPTVKEVQEVRADKKLGSPWGITGSFGGAVARPSIVTSVGGRYRITEKWIVGIDAGWNPWVTTSPMAVKSGVLTVSGVATRRFPMRFDRVNLRTTLHLGVSTLLFDVYGAPKYSTGPYLAFSPLGIDYDLGHAVRIIWDPMEMALPMPLVGQIPLYYEQFRFLIGLQIGG
jgi:uncharacterized protein (TIGR03382 family)